MDQGLLVGVLQALRGLAHEIARLFHGERSAFVHEALQRDAVDKLHHEVMGVAGMVGIDDADNVRMIGAGGRLSLAAEPAHRLLVGQAVLAPSHQGYRRSSLAESDGQAAAQPAGCSDDDCSHGARPSFMGTALRSTRCWSR